MQQTVIKPGTKMMNPFLNFIMDKWNLTGVLGTLITGFSIPSLGPEGGFITAFAGLIMAVVSVWQKYQQEKRNGEKHQLQMDLVKKIMKGEIEVDPEIVANFLK